MTAVEAGGQPEAAGSPEALIDSVFAGAVDGVALLDAAGRLQRLNRAYAELFGFASVEELEGRDSAVLLPSDELESLRSRAEPALEREGSWRGEVTGRRADGEHVLLDVSLTKLGDGRRLCVAREIGFGRETRSRLEKMAYYDPLTGLANRRLLREKAEHVLAVADRGGHEAALLFIDLNSFKELNDTLGHAAGDRTLEVVADRFRAAARDADTVARLGGDEFVVLLSEVEGETGAVRAAQRVLESLDEPVGYEGHQILISASVGIALYPRHAEDASQLLHLADVAMYGDRREKEPGIRVYRPRRDAETPRHGGLLDDLHEALRHFSFEVHYQPVRDLRDDSLRGAEALVRWRHPRLGLLSAAKFLPLVDDAELRRRLDRWVLAQTALQLRDWSERLDDLWIAVHLSEASCRDPELTDYLDRVLGAAGSIRRDRLVLQLPVRLAAEGNGSASAFRGEISRLGARAAVNAFAPGLAPLERLRKLAPDVLNLDRSVVSPAVPSSPGERLLRVAVDLGHTLGAKVVAKGVERFDQREALCRAGCDFALGYLEGWSVPPSEFPSEESGTASPASSRVPLR